MPAGYGNAGLDNPLISLGSFRNHRHVSEQPLVDDGRFDATHQKHLVILDDDAIRAVDKLGPEVGRQLIVELAPAIDEIKFDEAARGPVRAVHFFPHFLHPL